jgi:DNA-directed RNA polymerase specialized sigma24 family protein
MTAPDAARLVEQYLALALSIANRWARVYPHLRDDLRSDASYALWRAATEFTPRYPDEPTRGFPALARTFVRFALTRRLKLSRRCVPSADLDPNVAPDLAAPDLDANLDAPVLLARLTPARREVVEMRLAGASFGEIAAARGVSGSGVRALFAKAVREMGGG